MADSDIKDFSPTLPDTNTTVMGVSIAEGTNAANINNAIRRLPTIMVKGDWGTNPIKADTINESTVDAGVTVDGMQIKDGVPVGIDGTTANDFLRLNANAKIPAVDGSLVYVPFKDEAGTSYTLVSGDEGVIIRTTNAAAVTVTIPADATTNFQIGTAFPVMQAGAGKVSFAAAVGVTIESPSSLLGAFEQYSTIVAIKRAANAWVLGGRLG